MQLHNSTKIIKKEWNLDRKLFVLLLWIFHTYFLITRTLHFCTFKGRLRLIRTKIRHVFVNYL